MTHPNAEVKLVGKKHHPVEATKTYVLEFSCTYEATIAAIRHEAEGRNRKIIPEGWIEKESQVLEGMCWIRFECEEPFVDTHINRVQRWLDQIDQACYLMIES